MQDAAGLSQPQRRPLAAHGVAAAVLGNALEFYDFGVYAAYAVMIGHAFFPFGSGFFSLLLSVATFGVGFVSRPLGGFLLGAYADRRGRKPAMTLTIALMALGTAAIGLLPTYAQIGIAAPILLVLARLVQGFSAGGELGASTIFLFESAPHGRKAQTGSWQLASQGVAGITVGLTGFLLARLLSPESLNGWGWRIPFLLGLVIAPVGVYIRNKLDETLDTSKAHSSTSGVFSDLLSSHWLGVLLALLAFSGVTITQYFFGYMTTFALTSLHLPATTALLANFSVGASTLVFALAGGWLADRFGLRTVTILPRLVLIFAIYPALLFVVNARTPGALLGMAALLTVFQAISGAVLILLVAQAFPAAIRTTGLATAFGIGAALFGGTAQVVFASLIDVTGNPLSPVWYVTATNIVSLVATVLMRPASEPEATPRFAAA